MRVRILGALELIDVDGNARPIGSANQRTVLAALLARRGEVVTIDALIDALWGNAPPVSAVSTLRTYVSRLRSHLGSALASRGGGFAIVIPPDDIDAGRFESLVDAARDADAAEAVDLLGAALQLWEGPAFGDRADADGVRAEAHRLEERRTAAREARATALLATGRIDEAVAAASALTTAAPLREGGWAVLVEALAAAHRTAEALRAFRRAAAALGDAGLEPSARLREAERIALSGEAIRGRVANADPTERAQPQRFDPPVVPSSFVGRGDDTRLIVELLDDSRLVTLTGPGGVGKTRLAFEVARRAAEHHEFGACVVELAPVDDPAAVPDIVVASLGLLALGRPSVDMLTGIGALDVLIVLDNAEHVIEAVAAACQLVLAGGLVARILVTSRERLALDGEQVWAVAPLAVAGPHASASQLFRERAGAVGAAPDDALVGRLVKRLDGLPLAIEMAAAQLDTTTAEELADALDGHLDDLRSPQRGVPSRHRSLADVLAWSEARLDDHEARTLAELSVFAGPVIAADIVGVLGQPHVADYVRQLARRSLVHVDRSCTPARFHLLQTIRSFARQRLAAAGRTEEMARRHAEWFVDAIRRADTELRSSEEAGAVDRLDSVIAELRAAHGWAAANNLDLAADLAAHLHIYAQGRFIDEPLIWAEQLLGLLAVDHPCRPVLLASAATRAIRRGDIADARQLASEAVALAGDTAAALPALDALTDAGLFDGLLVESSATARAMEHLAHRYDDGHYLAIAFSGEVLSAAYGGPAMSDYEIKLARLTDGALSPSGRGWIEYTRGELCQAHDPHRALVHYSDALAAARSVHNRYIEGAAIVSACSLRARVGDPREALDAFAEAIRHWIRLASTAQQLTTLRNLAVLLQRLDAPEQLAELLGAVDRGNVPTYGEEAGRLSAARAWAEKKLGPQRFEELSAVGAAQDVTAAASTALHLIEELSQSRQRT
jgi:predicted ATPase/DNA-binding SARP family transcriptional activator